MSADHISFEDRNVSWKENDRIQFDNNHITKILYCPLKLKRRLYLEIDTIMFMNQKVFGQC